MRPKQAEIIQALKVQATIDPQVEIRRTLDFLKAYLLRYDGLKAYVLGISGGQDSTLAGKLAQLAVEEVRQETKDESYQFYAIRLPYGVQADESDAQKALDFIQADQVLTVNIQDATQGMTQAIETANPEISISDYNQGNIKARQRMIAQYAVAGAVQGAVIGTDHAAEAVTGFYTKFGDGAADLMPLWRLTKGQGCQLLQALDCPPELYLKVPTADLEDEREMIADEEVLGVSYEVLDRYLSGQRVTDDQAAIIEGHYDRSEHKRHLPITIFDDFWQG